MKIQVELTDAYIGKFNINKYLFDDGISYYELGKQNNLVLSLVQNTEGCFLAGGSALALYLKKLELIKDWYLYFKDPKVFNTVLEQLKTFGFVIKNVSAFATTLQKDNTIVQLIKSIWCNTVKDIFLNFDFTICCLAMEQDNLFYLKEALSDILKNEYNLLFPGNPEMFFKRIARYGAKGFNPSPNCLKNMVEYINGTYIPSFKNNKWITGEIKTANIYESKAEILRKNLKGYGAEGPPGVPGVLGPPGFSDGPGPFGPTGAVDITMYDGPTGATGPAGPAGPAFPYPPKETPEDTFRTEREPK